MHLKRAIERKLKPLPKVFSNLYKNVDFVTRKTKAFKKATRITALVINFTKKLREKSMPQTITAIDMTQARNTLINSIQQTHYGEISAKLKNKYRKNKSTNDTAAKHR